MGLVLRSPAFEQGGWIPKKHTCDGANLSPALRWENPRDDARSFVILCTDPDAPGGIFRHWAAYDIPADWRELAEGHGPESLADGFKQAVNDFGKPGYAGPCPPEGHGPHHYHFRLMVLPERTLPVAAGVTCAEVQAVAEQSVFEEFELVGLYER